jgi:hypothetical protein
MPSHYFSYTCLTPVVFSLAGIACYCPLPRCVTLSYLSNALQFDHPANTAILYFMPTNKQTQIIYYFLSVSFKYYSQQALVKHTQYIKRDVFIVAIYVKSIYYQQENIINFDILSCQTCFWFVCLWRWTY